MIFPWSKDLDRAKNLGMRVYLTVEIKGERIATLGGWDKHWTGRCWLYDNALIPHDTIPIAWAPLPEVYRGL